MAGEVDADTDFGEQPYVTSLFLEQCLVRRCAASVHVPRADAYVVAATASVGSRVLASAGSLRTHSLVAGSSDRKGQPQVSRYRSTRFSRPRCSRTARSRSGRRCVDA